jgi:serine/threonine protein kinase
MSSSTSHSVITERFVLKELAGAGGMGTVYRALDTLTDQTVAVKFLQANNTPSGARTGSAETIRRYHALRPAVLG